jgi:hypothetical protein
VQAVAGDLVAQLSAFRGSDVLVNMGDDFAWPLANLYFPYTDGIIDALNSHPSARFNASYSTGERYMQAKLASVPAFPQISGDLFPYADDRAGHNLWAGYFTSRPAFKGLVRESSALQQGARQLQAAAGGAADTSLANPLSALERALGVAQHHDAISGTAKQRVDQDYIYQLAQGRSGAHGVVNASLQKLTGYSAGGGFAVCQLNNVSHCPALEAGGAAVVVVYNSLGQAAPAAPVRLTVGLPPGVASYAVSDGAGAPVTAQLLPLSPADAALRALYNASEPSTVEAVAWLCFQGAVPAAGFAAFFLVPAATPSAAPRTFPSTLRRAFPAAAGAAAAAAPPAITNGRLTLAFDAATGALASLSDAATGLAAVPLTQQWLAYTGADGRSFNGSSQASGAYIFRPLSSTPAPIAGGVQELQLLSGPVLSEARGVQGYVSQELRLWAGAGDVEVGWTVGPVDTASGSQEVIARYSAGAPAAAGGGGGGGGGSSTWVSDSNCREGQPRRTNWRPQWNYSGSEPVASNYFPTSCHVRTQVAAAGGGALTLALALDRAQGSSSLAAAQLEVMVHRRLLHDDGRGVGEALNEPGLDGRGLVVRGRHWLVLAPSGGGATALYKAAAQRALALPHTIVGFSPLGSTSPAAWLAAGHAPSASLLSAPLPLNVHLATLQSLGPARLLLRLAHVYDAGEDAALSGNVTVALGSLLRQGGALGGIISAVDLTLPASQPLAGLPSTTYATDAGERYTVPVLPAPPAGAALEVTLAPGDIRTLLCTTAV